MLCVECSREKDPDERGWVTVLSSSAALRIHYCPECMADLICRSSAGEAVSDDGDA